MFVRDGHEWHLLVRIFPTNTRYRPCKRTNRPKESIRPTRCYMLYRIAKFPCRYDIISDLRLLVDRSWKGQSGHYVRATIELSRVRTSAKSMLKRSCAHWRCAGSDCAPCWKDAHTSRATAEGGDENSDTWSVLGNQSHVSKPAHYPARTE
jgi:hypothetical protein